jgi:DNA-directed RNA polymerase subunit RPC12/RpoP
MTHQTLSNTPKRQCPRCNSRSVVLDYDDDPRLERAHAFLCLSCGRRFVPAAAPGASTVTTPAK